MGSIEKAVNTYFGMKIAFFNLSLKTVFLRTIVLLSTGLHLTIQIFLSRFQKTRMRQGESSMSNCVVVRLLHP